MPQVVLDYKNSSIIDGFFGLNTPDSAGNYTAQTLGISNAQSSILKFDLGLIPNNAIINSAKLSLSVYTNNAQAGTTPEAQNILNDFAVSTATLNNLQLGEAIQNIGSIPGASGFYDLDITTIAQQWVNGNGYGVLLSVGAKGGTSYLVSNDSTATTSRPKLTIDYTIPTDNKKQVEFVNTTMFSQSSGEASINIPITEQKKQGDLILIHFQHQHAINALPEGWNNFRHVESSGSNFSSIFYKFSDGTEENLNITTVTGALMSPKGTVTIFRNVKNLQWHNAQRNSSSIMDLPAENLAANRLMIVLMDSLAASTITFPLNFKAYLQDSSNARTVGIAGSYNHDKTSYSSTELRVTNSNNSTINTGILISLEPITNQAPNTPPTNSPKGTQTNPEVISTTTPILDWSFSDPDAGDAQTKYRARVRRTSDGAIVHDTNVVTSAETEYTVPNGIIQTNELYYWEVQTYDKAGSVSPWSSPEYFSLVPDGSFFSFINPGNYDKAHPDGSSKNPLVKWGFAEEFSQTSYQIKLYDDVENLVFDTGKLESELKEYQVPDNVLISGKVYGMELIVSGGEPEAYYPSNRLYFITNNLPTGPVLTLPEDNKRTNKQPVFEAIIGDDIENDNQHFVIQLSTDSDFVDNLEERSTEISQDGWYAKKTSGEFAPIPSTGLDASYEGGTVRYTWTDDLTDGITYHWRLIAIDGASGARGTAEEVRTIRVGDTLIVQNKNPIRTSAAAERIIFTIQKTIAQDGENPASFKIEVCNNATDQTPTWEDATEASESGDYYLFENKTKTAENWAIGFKATVKANDTLGALSIDGVGFSFD